jgi:Ca2+-binding RTX toxin-like protein
MLALVANFNAGRLSVTESVAAADDVRITVSGGVVQVLSFGSPLPIGGAGAPAPGAVEEIFVDSNSRSDRVDLRDVTPANGFTLQLNSNVEVEAGNGTNNGVDTIYGSAFDDKLGGGADPDSIHGGPGNDTLAGERANDTLLGEAGDDYYEFELESSANGTDRITEVAGEGSDTIDLSKVNVAVQLDLSNPNSQTVAGGGVALSLILTNPTAVENALASRGSYDDTLVGNSVGNLLQGRGGADAITGGGGDDLLEGGDGADNLDGGAGNDTVNGGGGADVVAGGTENDLVSGDGFTDPIVTGPSLQNPDDQTLNEPSGLVAGRGPNTGILWSVEDHDAAAQPLRLYANNVDGTSRGYFDLAGVTNVDWEDLAFYQSGSARYLYVADIGDNDSNRGNVVIYRLSEPTVPTDPNDPNYRRSHGTITVTESLTLQYPGGPRDAEAMFVDPLTGRIHIVSKQEPGAVSASRLYSYLPSAADWTSGVPRALAYDADLAFPSDTANDSPSAADISPDGLEVVVKSDNRINYYARTSAAQSLASLLAGRPQQVIDARDTDNRETIAFDAAGASLYSVSEWSPGAQAVLRYDRGTGVDNLTGGAGDDRLQGGRDNDSLAGGTGGDTYVFATAGSVSLGDDTVDEAGTADATVDVLDFQALGQGVTLDLATPTTLQNVAPGRLRVALTSGSGIENVRGSELADTLFGNARPNRLDGLGGNDRLTGRGGVDALYGGAGTDYLNGAQDGWADQLYGNDDGASRDTLVADNADTATTGANDVVVRPPASPTNLTATQVNASGMTTLNWQGTFLTDPHDVAHLEYSTDGVNFTTYGTTAAAYHGGQIYGLAQNTRYYFRVRVTNDAGSSYSNTMAINLPVPATPGSLTATAVTASGTSDLSWTGTYSTSPTDVVHMEVSTNGTNFTEYGTTIAAYHWGRLNGLSQAATYYVRVRVSNAAGFSGYSNVYVINPTVTPPPQAPTNLTASAVNEWGASLLHWDGTYRLNPHDVAHMEYSTDGVNFTEYGTTIAAYHDGYVYGLSPNTTYYFRVYVTNAGGTSGYSNVYVLNAVVPPQAPDNLSASPVDGSGLSVLTWSGSYLLDPVDVAHLEYSTDGWNFSEYGTTYAAYHSGYVYGLSQNTTYYFRVYVTNAAGTSGYSNVYVLNPNNPGVPETPWNLTATSVDQNGASLLHWEGNYNFDPVDVAHMEYSTDGSTFYEYGTTYAAYHDGYVYGLSQGTTYYFRVKVTNAAGESGYSNVYQI